MTPCIWPGVLLSSVINVLNLLVAHLCASLVSNQVFPKNFFWHSEWVTVIYIRIKEQIIISDSETEQWNNSRKTELSAEYHVILCIWMKIPKCVSLSLVCRGGLARMLSMCGVSTHSCWQKDFKVCFDHYFQQLSTQWPRHSIRRGTHRVTLLPLISSPMTWQ